jgi:DNA-binding response OmpR family regulator
MSTGLWDWKSALTTIFPSRSILVSWSRAFAPFFAGREACEPAIPEMLRVGDIELDPATRTVRHAGKPVDLTSVEFNLLQVLLREAGRVVTREDLASSVLSRKFSPFDRSIDMHVSKVRKKLGDSDGGTDHIKTVRGVGYIFTRPRDAGPREEARRGAK